MDAFIGNTPFAGKNGIADMAGPAYLPWLLREYSGSHGNSDYSAYFFRRTFDLLGSNGALGLIATKTIAQGDTRTTGLKPIVADGGRIYEAIRSMKWPGEASVLVAKVHIAKGCVAKLEGLNNRLDYEAVPAINSRLIGKTERPDPVVLTANEGLSYVGSYVLGMGFTLTPEQRSELIKKDPRNGQLIFPYIGGEEVNTSPTQAFHRYVINFGDRSLEEAEAWPDLMRIVREKVKPERDRLRDNADGKRRKQYWWQFGRITPALYESLQGKKRVLVTSRVTKYIAFSLLSSETVISERLFVFPIDNWDAFSVLQSRIHEPWVRHLSSTLGATLNYAASDCFENFPFPPAGAMQSLKAIGQDLYEARAKFMVNTDQGLTKTYNLLKDPNCADPRIINLRHLHEEMDRAVLSAYGWSDIKVPPFQDPTTEAAEKALESFKDEIIDRLFALNAQRAEEERIQGAMVSNIPRINASKNSKTRTKSTKPMPFLKDTSNHRHRKSGCG
jgi:hypothetical protein